MKHFLRISAAIVAAQLVVLAPGATALADTLPFASSNQSSSEEDPDLQGSPVSGPLTTSIPSYNSVELSGGELGVGYRDHDGKTYDGSGQIIVIIDGAFNTNHYLLKSRIIGEACFGEVTSSDPKSLNNCSSKAVPLQSRSSVVFEEGPGTSRPDITCQSGERVCQDTHGTATTSFAAGSNFSANIDGEQVRGSGIAPKADLIVLKVGGRSGWSSDAVAAALEFTASTLSARYPGRIASVSVSDSGSYNHPTNGAIGLVQDGKECVDYRNTKSAIESVKNKNIAVVVSSGNLGKSDALGWRACFEDATSVGATNVTNLNTVTDYSNISTKVDLLAPVGDDHELTGDPAATPGRNRLWGAYSPIQFADPVIPNMGLGYFRGTSFAAPQTAGAYAVLRQKWPGRPVGELTDLLRQTGVRVKDSRPANGGLITPRMVVGEALRSRGDRPSFDFTRDSLMEFPYLAEDGKTLKITGMTAAGVLTSTEIALAGDWSGKTLLNPVSDLLSAGTNGFVTNSGAAILYYEYDSGAKTLKAPVNILDGFGGAYTRSASVKGLNLPGTGTGMLFQHVSGAVVLRTVNPAKKRLGDEIVVQSGFGYDLIGAADMNNDGNQDLVMREKSSGFPVFRKGTGGEVAPFSGSVEYLSKDDSWSSPNLKHLFVSDDFYNGQPVIGYWLESNRNIIFKQLNEDGTANFSKGGTAKYGFRGRILFANDY